MVVGKMQAGVCSCAIFAAEEMGPCAGTWVAHLPRGLWILQCPSGIAHSRCQLILAAHRQASIQYSRGTKCTV